MNLQNYFSSLCPSLGLGPGLPRPGELLQRASDTPSLLSRTLAFSPVTPSRGVKATLVSWGRRDVEEPVSRAPPSPPGQPREPFPPWG